MQLEKSTLNTINTWLNGNYDQDTKAEIQSLLAKEAVNITPLLQPNSRIAKESSGVGRKAEKK